jgi:hydroxymethylbilane synthase
LKQRSDLLEILAPLSCHETTACALAERAVSRALGGSCQVPLAAYASIQGQQLTIRALVATPDGKTIYRAEAAGPSPEALTLGLRVAQDLREQGAAVILANLAATTGLNNP